VLQIRKQQITYLPSGELGSYARPVARGFKGFGCTPSLDNQL